MNVCVLASGSKGNCIYIEGSNGALLVDAGLSAREILNRVETAGGSVDRIEAILVTHEHTDHIRGGDVLARRLGIPVVATRGTLSEYLDHRRSSRKPLQTTACRCGEPLSFGDFFIEPFATSHDAIEPCGFCIREHDLEVGCCTDTGEVSPAMLERLRRCDALVIESNHCPEMLENGPYPAFLKKRIRDVKRGHLSNIACAACLKSLADDLHAVTLAHLSEVNNRPEIALAAATSAGGLGLFAGSIPLRVARQHEVTETMQV
ncbi:MAG: MBL fold metallo-hydrolase [Methanomicrobiaceae archaeon]|nr:MBL fold metallo-hydrolase [Methanomicrobiaceae archaeon]